MHHSRLASSFQTREPRVQSEGLLRPVILGPWGVFRQQHPRQAVIKHPEAVR